LPALFGDIQHTQNYEESRYVLRYCFQKQIGWHLGKQEAVHACEKPCGGLFLRQLPDYLVRKRADRAY
jgi:hypothetical protein